MRTQGTGLEPPAIGGGRVILAALLPFVVRADATPVTFTYRPTTSVEAVYLAGSFNGWNATGRRMERQADGTWTTQIELPYGKHWYKFVLDGKTWVTDPNGKSENDGNGNENSFLFVMPADYGTPAAKGDGTIARSALKHENRAPLLNVDRGRLTLSFRARPDDVEDVKVWVDGKAIPMREVGRDELYATYQASLPWNDKRALTYQFEAKDGANTVTDGPYKLDPKVFRPFTVPSWVERSVFYQIFPDRFENGSRENDPKDVQPWDGKPTWYNRFGGDAVGVAKHVDYLKGLGVNAVYFNPVFKAPSNHRYDAEDYRQVDPQFGTNKEFGDLTRALRRNGIRTVMDFVFNHTATTFPAFLDIRQKGESSPYKDWYFIHSYPVRVETPPNYTAWYGYPSMPKLNLANPVTRAYMLNLVEFWSKNADLSGIRLDVANEVDPDFWRALRPYAKTVNPEMWIVGEVWGDGSPWLGGDQWDSVMNYQFRDACLQFIARRSQPASWFANRLMGVYRSYAPQVSRNMMNLISSHDTPRFLTEAGGNRDLQRLAATVQFTWVGAPSVYYGEELGMEGGADPENRRPMRWDLAKGDNDMLAHYRRLIRLRESVPVLQTGDPAILLADDKMDAVAFARTLDRNAAVVALNRHDAAQTISFPLPEGDAYAEAKRLGFVDALTGRRYAVEGGQLSIPLGSMQAAVLLPATRASLRLSGDLAGLTRNPLIPIRSLK